MTKTLTELRATAPWLLHVSTDIVIFTIREGELRVLLRRRYSEAMSVTCWALPGGYLGPVEPLEQCAQRTLAHQTGIDDVYLEQLYTFGRPDRHPKSRVITVAYFALIPWERVCAESAEGVPHIAWRHVDALPDLYLDHAEIIDQARQRLVSKLQYSTIGFEFMPEQFTLGDLQCVYETILGEPLDKRNFRKKVLAFGCVEDTGEQRRNGSHRPARLYRYTAPGEVLYIK